MSHQELSDELNNRPVHQFALFKIIVGKSFLMTRA